MTHRITWVLRCLVAAALLCPGGPATASPPATGNDGDYYLETSMASGTWLADGESTCTQTAAVWRYEGGGSGGGGSWVPVTNTSVMLYGVGASGTELWTNPNGSDAYSTDDYGIATASWRAHNDGTGSVDFYVAINDGNNTFTSLPASKTLQHPTTAHTIVEEPKSNAQFSTSTIIPLRFDSLPEGVTIAAYQRILSYIRPAGSMLDAWRDYFTPHDGHKPNWAPDMPGTGLLPASNYSCIAKTQRRVSTDVFWQNPTTETEDTNGFSVQ